MKKITVPTPALSRPISPQPLKAPTGTPNSGSGAVAISNAKAAIATPAAPAAAVSSPLIDGRNNANANANSNANSKANANAKAGDANIEATNPRNIGKTERFSSHPLSEDRFNAVRENSDDDISRAGAAERSSASSLRSTAEPRPTGPKDKFEGKTKSDDLTKANLKSEQAAEKALKSVAKATDFTTAAEKFASLEKAEVAFVRALDLDATDDSANIIANNVLADANFESNALVHHVERQRELVDILKTFELLQAAEAE